MFLTMIGTRGIGSALASLRSTPTEQVHRSSKMLLSFFSADRPTGDRRATRNERDTRAWSWLKTVTKKAAVL